MATHIYDMILKSIQYLIRYMNLGFIIQSTNLTFLTVFSLAVKFGHKIDLPSKISIIASYMKNLYTSKLLLQLASCCTCTTLLYSDQRIQDQRIKGSKFNNCHSVSRRQLQNCSWVVIECQSSYRMVALALLKYFIICFFNKINMLSLLTKHYISKKCILLTFSYSLKHLKHSHCVCMEVYSSW